MQPTKPGWGFFIASLSLAAVPMTGQIVRPQLGYVMDSGGGLRPVIGVAAAASLGDSALDNAVSFACSAKLCLAKTDAALIPFAPANAAGALTAPAESTPSLAGPALIAIDDQAGGRAWIYFTQWRQAALWRNGTLTMIDFDPGGSVLSLRAAADGFDYAVARYPSQGKFRRRAAPVWIEHYSASDGSITVVAPAATGATFADPFAVTGVMLLEGGVLWGTSGELILTRPDGDRVEFPLPGARAFFNAGKGYLEVVAAEGLWILRTDPGSEQLALLPGAPHEVPSAPAAEGAP